MTLLFACVGNSCRSQMAEGVARKLGQNVGDIYSAGSHPEQEVSPQVIKVMQEVGMDISSHYPKGSRAFPHQTFDLVVTMGCGSTEQNCPCARAKRQLAWAIEDPRDQPLQAFRRVRNQIEAAGKELFRDLESPNEPACT